MAFDLDNLKFWELHRRISYRLQEWDNPAFANRDRDSYRDFYTTELERAYKVFTNNPEICQQLPDDRCDPIIGLNKIKAICRQVIEGNNSSGNSRKRDNSENTNWIA